MSYDRDKMKKVKMWILLAGAETAVWTVANKGRK
jgi:hypothetical protein